MATKAQVRSVAKKQGAEFTLGLTETGEVFCDIVLPTGKMWDNNYRLGQIYQEKDRHETWPEFWDSLLCVINSPIIDEK